jgi:hypothetical protein
VIVTFMPTSPVAGSKEVMVGAGTVTVKSSELRPVPPGVVTSIRPVFAPAGTVVSIRVLDTVVKLAEVPSNRTLVAPSKFVPVSVTEVPTGPRFGEQDTMVGAGMNVKSLALVVVPPGVVTLILPVVAPAGTDVSIRVAETTVKLAVVPSNRTPVAPPKFVPVIVTEVPIGPLAGAKESMVGAGMNVKSLGLVAVPPGVVTRILPVVAPGGTVVLI